MEAATPADADAPRTPFAWWVATFVVLAAALVLAAPPLVDDAFITLCYARTLVEAGEWGVFPGHPANTATSPLNVLLLSGLGGLIGSFPTAARLLAALSFTGAGFLVARAVRPVGAPFLGAVCSVALAANPLLLSTIGLESPLMGLWIALALWAASSGHSVTLGLATGLLVLTRPDGALLLPVLLVLVRRTELRWGRAIAAAAVVVVPWTLVQWVWLGGAIPDTYFLKTAQRWGPDMGFLQGFGLYAGRDPLPVVGSVVLAPLAVFAVQRGGVRRALVGSLLTFAVLTFVAYAVMDPPPYHWYFVPQALPLTLAGLLGLVTLAETRPRTACAAVSVPLLVLAGSLVQDSAEDGPGAVEPLIHSNLGVERQYEEIGRRIAELVPEGESIRSQAELGTLAFHSRRFLVDEFSDAPRALKVVGLTSDGSAFAETLRRWIHAHRDRSLRPTESSWFLLQTFEYADLPPDTRVFTTRTKVGGVSHLLLRRAER